MYILLNTTNLKIVALCYHVPAFDGLFRKDLAASHFDL
jgi:hypothetical protein